MKYDVTHILGSIFPEAQSKGIYILSRECHIIYPVCIMNLTIVFVQIQNQTVLNIFVSFIKDQEVHIQQNMQKCQNLGSSRK
jgi:hypothetical protein